MVFKRRQKKSHLVTIARLEKHQDPSAMRKRSLESDAAAAADDDDGEHETRASLTKRKRTSGSDSMHDDDGDGLQELDMGGDTTTIILSSRDRRRLLSNHFFRDGFYACPIPGCDKLCKSYIGLEYHIKRVIHTGVSPEFLASLLGQLVHNNRERDEFNEKKRETLGGPTISSRHPTTTSPRKSLTNSEVFPCLDTSFPLMVHYSKNLDSRKDTISTPRSSLPSHEPILAKLVSDTHLPKPNFQLLQHPLTYEGAFAMATTYIRYIEPTSDDIDASIEYDMDEEDQFWLTAINAQRRDHYKATTSLANPSIFEFIMDRLEKEWYSQVRKYKELHTEDHVYPSPDESKCAVCNDSECENSNAIVFCDGCNLAVHQDCYGVPYIPEGQWLCRRCLLAPDKILKCVFCPNQGGALKQTLDSRWAHVLCAYWIPEAGFANPVYMEPIDGVDNVPKARWKLRCYICRKIHGACIQCAHKKCFTSFHVTCGRKLALPLPMKMGENAAVEGIDLKAYCHRHAGHNSLSMKSRRSSFSNREKLSDSESLSGSDRSRDILLNMSDTSDQDHDDDDDTEKSRTKDSSSSNNDSSTAQKSKFPYVSVKMFEALMHSLRSYSIANKTSLLISVCIYWTLKRRSRRGAPLLKRLIFQSYSPVIASKPHDDLDSLKLTQTNAIRYLRHDLERLRILTELVRRRERLKHMILEVQKEICYTIFFPLETILYKLWNVLKSKDTRNIFAEPVDPKLVPDYLLVIKRPMSFKTIESNIIHNRYSNFKEFQADVYLMYQNAMIYNKPHTVYFKTAQILLKESEELFRITTHLMRKAAFYESRKFLDVPSGLFNRSIPSSPPKSTTITPQPSTKSKYISRPSKKTSSSSLSPLDMHQDASHHYTSILDLLNHQKNFSTTFHEGDLVWAKITGFPWYPSQIVNPSTMTESPSSRRPHPNQDGSIPSFRDSHTTATSYSVMFFDRPEGKRTHTWLSQHDLFPLGENPNFDKLFLNYSKKTHQRKTIRHAYSEALNKK